ncbi:MAG: YkgJ family cysteine cluster protein [Bacteriovoracia bacterium]
MTQKNRNPNFAIPALAFKTFTELKDDSKYFSFTEKIILLLNKIHDPIRRARKLHDQIEKCMDRLFAKDEVKASVNCTKGCTFCCHTQVAVTEDEAKLLASRILNSQNSIDLYRLHTQAKAGVNIDKWYQIPHAQRACVFLGKDGGCSVYEDRPSVCRTNNAVSDPSSCSTEDGIEKPQNLLLTHEADMIITGAFAASKENGPLPFMLKKVLLKHEDYLKNSSVWKNVASVLKMP